MDSPPEGFGINDFVEFGKKLQSDEKTEQTAAAVIDKILKVLDDGLEQIKIALIIPKLFKNLEELEKYVPKDEIDIVLNYCNSYIYDAKNAEKKENCLLNYYLIKIITGLFYNNFKTSEFLMENSKVSAYILKEIEDIFKIAELRVNTPGKVELFRERFVQEAYRKNNNLKDTIASFRKQLFEKEKAIQEKIAEKTELMKTYRVNMEEAFETYKVEASKLRDESCQQIIQILSASEAAEERLKEDAERAKTSYAALLKESLAAEKKLHERKHRALAQYLGLVEKYDNDMVDRVLQINQIKEKTVEKKKELKNLMAEFALLREEYLVIFPDGDEEDREIARQAKILKFQQTHAVKVLQKAWRYYIKNKYRKPKAKAKPAKPPKGKKQPKETEEPPEDTKEKPKGGKGKKQEEVVEEPKEVKEDKKPDSEVKDEEKTETEDVVAEDVVTEDVVAEVQEEKKAEDEDVSAQINEVQEEKKAGDEDVVADVVPEETKADNEITGVSEVKEEKKTDNEEVVTENKDVQEDNAAGDGAVPENLQESEENKTEGITDTAPEGQEKQKKGETDGGKKKKKK